MEFRFRAPLIILLVTNLTALTTYAFQPRNLLTSRLPFALHRRNALPYATAASTTATSFIPPPPPPPPLRGTIPTTTTPWDETNVVLDRYWQEMSKILNERLQLSSEIFLNQNRNGKTLPSFEEQQWAMRTQIASIDATILQELEPTVLELKGQILSQFPQAGPFMDELSTFIHPAIQSPVLSLGIAAVTIMVVANAVFLGGDDGNGYNKKRRPSQPYPNLKYDPNTAEAYFNKKPFLVLIRTLSIFLQSTRFCLGLLYDKINGKIAESEMKRGRELAQLLTVLGPTFIKVGQSLSIRTDLLSPAYIRGLETLQDQVPAFDTVTARQILETEWGRPVSDILIDLPNQPVAAASLGQVYKAKLKSTGKDVAIKVQRPAITEQIALDMYLLRRFAAFVKPVFKLNTDTVGTVDAWGLGFVDELDYLQEAANAQFFSAAIANTPLKEVVFAPAAINEYSTRSVLVTEWVEGERLDRSSNRDVTVLCSIAMNTYLTMLLELGLLHCDPHPGNLLRSPDGRLCILDWGMVTRLDKNLQLTLIEHMAHLTSGDYAEVPRDLLLLGFIPESKAHLIKDSGVVEVLADVYGQWTAGGGVAGINVNEVIVQLQDLTAKKGNLFQIPPYFAYIAKSFSVLEGIGLSNDSKYSIVNECLPYVSKRLLTDKEKMGPALSTYLFGPEKSNPDRIVTYKRVKQLVEGFGEYTASSSGSVLGKEGVPRLQLLESTADQILDLVFSEEETPLQQILIEQLAKIVSSSGRAAFTNIRERSGILPSGRTVLGTVLDPLGLWRTSPLVRMNEIDDKTLETTQKILGLLQNQTREKENSDFDLSTLSRDEAITLSSMLVRKVWNRRSGVLKTGNRFARQLLTLTAAKLEIGERDTRALPPRRLVDAENGIGSSLVVRATESTQRKSVETQRLQAARLLLKELQSDEMPPQLPDILPVKSNL